jgi:hypothetical protein
MSMSKGKFCEKVGISTMVYDEKAAEFIELTERMNPAPAKPQTPTFAIRSAIQAQTRTRTVAAPDKEKRKLTRREALEARRRAAAEDKPHGE